MKMKEIVGFLLFGLAIKSGESAMMCELQKSKSRSDYKINDAAANGIVYDNGTSSYSMQVFQCTCASSNEVFDDREITNFDKNFYKSGVMDWIQSQVLRIYNCSSLTLDLKTGKNTISQLLSGKLLIVEDVTQLILTGFTAGIPFNVDETFSSIYFRNVTFYQIPPFLEFSDRFEVLFSQIKTDEGSSKVEPFEMRVKNANYSRNPVFRIEYSRFGGVNILTDGYNHDVFVLKVSNMQPYNNVECYKDYKGSVQLVGNFFGYLRDKNINVTNGEDFLMEDNFVDTLYGNPIWLVNLKQTKVRSNMFGFQLLEPVISVSYFRSSSTSSRSCSSYDMPETAVTVVDFSGNQVRKLTTSSFVKLDIDPSYSINFVDKISVLDIRVALPCNCTDKNFTSKTPSDSEKFGMKSIKESHCIPWRMGLHLMPPQMGRRTEICSGGSGSSLSQQYSVAPDQAGSQAWLANNPYFQGSQQGKGSKDELSVSLLIGLMMTILIWNKFE